MKFNPFLSLLLVFGVLLAACAPGAPLGTATQVGPGAPVGTGTQVEPVAPGEPVEKTIIIGPELVDCEGVATQKCMQVKESAGDEYTLFSGQIEGFEFEEGNQYTLVVREEPVANPPADAPNVKWTLVRIESQAPGTVGSKTQEPAVTQPPATPPAGAGEIEGQRWLLQSYLDAAGKLALVIPGSQVTAEFMAGQVTGNASCNSYFASYQASGDSIQIGPPGSTLMLCTGPAGVMDQESAYLAALPTAASYQVSAGVLEIKDSAGQLILVYAAETPDSLMDVTWRLETYTVGTDAASPAVAGTQVTAIFGEDGSLGGSAGCNTYGASYTLAGESIKIEPPVSTMMFCSEPPGVMDQEAAYLALLPQAASYSLAGGKLTLRDASGVQLLVFGLSEQKTLTDTDWYLSLYYVGGDAVTTPLQGTFISARFSPDGQMTGSAGCNSFNATYEVDGSALRFGPVATTKKACAEPQGVMEQESAILAILEATAAYAIKDDRLILRDASGADLAEFTGSELVAVEWKWQAIRATDGSVMSAPDPERYTVAFLPDGNLGIQADCNQAGGTYTVSGDRLSIEIGAVTLALCPEGSQSQEFLNLLGQASSFLAQEDSLVINLQDNAGSMQFGR